MPPRFCGVPRHTVALAGEADARWWVGCQGEEASEVEIAYELLVMRFLPPSSGEGSAGVPGLGADVAEVSEEDLLEDFADQVGEGRGVREEGMVACSAPTRLPCLRPVGGAWSCRSLQHSVTLTYCAVPSVVWHPSYAFLSLISFCPTFPFPNSA